MTRVRKVFVWLLILVLLVSLLGGAFSFSTNANLGQPSKLETWLNQSDVYSNLVTNELKNAQQSAGADVGAGRVALTDPEVEQAVQAVFTTPLLQQYANTFLQANYAWLKGQTATPSFKIDLTAAKQQLAQKVGQNVKTRMAGLSACSATQLAQLQTTLDTDPLSIPCVPPGVTPDTAAAQATAQIAKSSDFLNHPVLTASQLNPNGGMQRQPYYQRFSKAPKLYKLNRKLPWIALALALLSAIGIIFLTSWRRRRGVRRVAILLVLAGLVLIAERFVADSLFNRVQKKIFANSNLSQVQQSLTAFLRLVEKQLVKTDFWFGIAFLVLGLVVLIGLWLTREKLPSQAKGAKGDIKPLKPGTTFAPDEQGRPQLPVFKKPAPSTGKRPPRLIQ